jgi:drug/metabolite transporter (DMT)-like permease
VPPLFAAAIGMISSFAMIRAAQLAPAAKLAPASYLEIASGALIGIFFFGEYLDLPKITGILIIVAVCLTNTLLNEAATVQKKCR